MRRSGAEMFALAAARALAAPDDARLLRELARAAARALGAETAAIRFHDAKETVSGEWRAPSARAKAAQPRRFDFSGGELQAIFPPPLRGEISTMKTVAATLALAAAGWRRARRAARRDPLTGLPNRAALREALARAWSEAERYGAPLAVAVADADGFKAWNERYGHAAGDRALRRIARALRRGARASDFIARWGGDEFVLLLPRTDRAGAEALALRLSAATRPALTIGVAARAEDAARGPADLLRKADAALRRAKRLRGAE